MPQKLQLPIPQICINAAYKNAAYRTRFGFTHYGIDAVSTLGATDRSVRAMGDGTVIVYGNDTLFGNTIVIAYKDVQLNDGRILDLACRMYHFASISVKNDQKVKAGDVIGQYGATGKNVTGAHLHLTFDCDIKYPRHEMGLAASGNIIFKGIIDSTLDPSKVWYVAQGQSVTRANDAYSSDADIKIPTMPLTTPSVNVDKIAQLESENATLKQAMKQMVEIANKYL